jgi:triacylglycerol lipase
MPFEPRATTAGHESGEPTDTDSRRARRSAILQVVKDSSDVTPFVDPEIRDLLAALPPFGPLDASNLEATRSLRRDMAASLQRSSKVDRTEHTVPGLAGAPDISLRVLRPAGAFEPLPCVYWIHGGGYVMGSPDQDDVRFDRWCCEQQVVGVCVRYRLAPETAFPGPLDDCVAGLEWVLGHADEIGVDSDRVGIGGASAGGGLAAALTLVARDRSLPVRFQILIYPMLDDRMVTASSHWDVPIWPRPSNEFGWSSYLGPLRGGDVPGYAAPARAADLSGLPPTILVVGGADGFVDEDLDYAARLNRAGVQVELHLYPGAPHGFESFAPTASVSRRCHRDLASWLAEAARAGTARGRTQS